MIFQNMPHVLRLLRMFLMVSSALLWSLLKRLHQVQGPWISLRPMLKMARQVTMMSIWTSLAKLFLQRSAEITVRTPPKHHNCFALVANVVEDAELDALLEHAVTQEDQTPLPADYRKMTKKPAGARKKPAGARKKPAASARCEITISDADLHVDEKTLDGWISRYSHEARTSEVRKRVHSMAYHKMAAWCRDEGFSEVLVREQAQKAGQLAANRWRNAVVHD